jgi:hypothetical protein
VSYDDESHSTRQNAIYRQVFWDRLMAVNWPVHPHQAICQ